MLAHAVPQKLHLRYHTKQGKPSEPDIRVLVEPHPHHAALSHIPKHG